MRDRILGPDGAPRRSEHLVRATFVIVVLGMLMAFSAALLHWGYPLVGAVFASGGLAAVANGLVHGPEA